MAGDREKAGQIEHMVLSSLIWSVCHSGWKFALDARMFLFPSTSSLAFSLQCCAVFFPLRPEILRVYVYTLCDCTYGLMLKIILFPSITHLMLAPKSNSNNSTTNIKQTNKINDDHLNIQRLLCASSFNKYGLLLAPLASTASHCTNTRQLRWVDAAAA